MMNDSEKHITATQVRKLLLEADRPLTRRHMSHAFNMDKEASDRFLKPVLQSMIERGELVRNRRAAYGLAEQMDLVQGRISAHPDGFGFVVPDEGGDDLYLSPKQMRVVFNGDRVLAAVTRVDRRGRKEGGIVEVVERAHAQVAGRLLIESGVAMVVPDDPRLTQDILVSPEGVGNAGPGQIVVVRIDRPPTFERSAVGEIIAVLGHADEPGIATDIAVYSHQLPHEFSREVVREAKDFGSEINPAHAEGRLDLRDLKLLTIDGADARDFDDAVYAEPQGEGYRLLVAIADVAEYVRPGSALDVEAQRRGTSVYFPDRVIPMLPEALSNGLCSLNPKVDRLCLVCEMRIDARGKVTSSRFHEAVMRSHARLTYDQVRRIMEAGDPPLIERFGHVVDNLQHLYKVFRLLFSRRERRGALDFDSRQAYFEFDTDGRVAGIRLQQRHDAHRLIEEFMIAANVEASKFVARGKLPFLYRVHEPPPDDKLESLETFLRAHGLEVRWSEKPEPLQFAAIQHKVAGRTDAPLVNAHILRSLSLAVYQPENKGHFGLALDSYSHFTSPIRRYPDLLLHRAIKHLVRGRPGDEFAYDRRQMNELGRHCSWTERRAEDAARDVDERLKCQFMKRHIGDVFEGIVTGVTSFGLFVELTELAVSGLVHVTAMPNDYYQFDPVGSSLTGKRRGLSFRLADPVRVEVIGVSLEERKIDFQLVEDEKD
ncbi:ribonuclease R [Wenzhouxiangella sp. AB-CW3]|uniref:ribonuclease R n=1 Tax=Wenzhouxiangella sp. AB-CW3 TaxID=2771012 RepID=UPI00168B9602|nr:ribonuclease R [Wenzhouxiangella sp. AB-CW3]QOC23964.1 ribonuclease R [Wenzhouxiangella sp. AB-CW3]